MTSETTDLLDTLCDLLRDRTASVGSALNLVEEPLQKELCASERAMAHTSLSRLLETLQAFLVVADSEKAAELSQWMTIIQQDGMVAETEFRRAMMALLPPVAKDTAPHALYGSLPASLVGRIRAIFSLSKEETASVDDLNQALTQIGQEREKIDDQEAMKQEERWQTLLIQMGLTLSDAHHHGRLLDKNMQSILARGAVDGSPHRSRVLESLVRKQLVGWHRTTGDLKSRKEDGREQVTRLKERVDQLEQAITLSREALFIDPETAIPGRASFVAHLHRYLERAMHLGDLFSLALIQIEAFDTLLGRLDKEEAAQFVRTISALIRSSLQEKDFLARLGVDRFAILFPASRLADSQAVTQQIGFTLNHTAYKLSHMTTELQVRVGALTFEPGMTVEEMLKATDDLASAFVQTGVKEQDRVVLNVREA